MKEQYATKRLLLIPANKSLTEAVTDYYVRNRAFFQPFDPVCGEEFLPTVTSGHGWIWTSRMPCRRRATGFIW